MELCPSADDIWLNWMAKLNDKKIRHSGIETKYTLIKVIKSEIWKKKCKTKL